jgi:hypothetical protein
LAFKVEDATAEYRKLTTKYKGTVPPFEEGKWMLAYVKDPNGNWIELGSRLRMNRNRK